MSDHGRTNPDDSVKEELAQIASKLQIPSCKRHVFLCIGDSCCSQEAGEKSWKALKNLLKEQNLSLSDSPSACFRTKVGCLRVCKGGPILVVYPEGHWYFGMTADKIPEFVDRQIVKGEPISEWIFATNPLS
ncbi:MAG: ferredoxin [Pirellula sp.]|nr:ferredoxin [Pirellula sp.]